MSLYTLLITAAIIAGLLAIFYYLVPDAWVTLKWKKIVVWVVIIIAGFFLLSKLGFLDVLKKTQTPHAQIYQMELVA